MKALADRADLTPAKSFTERDRPWYLLHRQTAPSTALNFVSNQIVTGKRREVCQETAINSLPGRRSVQNLLRISGWIPQLQPESRYAANLTKPAKRFIGQQSWLRLIHQDFCAGHRERWNLICCWMDGASADVECERMYLFLHEVS